jgi:hypothetical protein
VREGWEVGRHEQDLWLHYVNWAESAFSVDGDPEFELAARHGVSSRRRCESAAGWGRRADRCVQLLREPGQAASAGCGLKPQATTPFNRLAGRRV